MSKQKKRTYRVMYMLSSSMDEKAVGEFIQKFEQEISQLGSVIEITNKDRQQMVKTANNKNNRNAYLITTYFKAFPTSIAEIKRFLRLAQGVVLNFMILSEKEIAQNYSMA